MSTVTRISSIENKIFAGLAESVTSEPLYAIMDMDF
jgi:hypothetical protein